MKVCIAEKPSVAQSIASILGATRRCNGYFEGNDYQVTWTFGHLCELKSPEEYTPFWKPWAESRLPMIPQTFGITLKNDEGVKKQFDVIATLYASADCIINCGDAGQEGELIQRWVMQKAGIIYNRERNVYVRPDQKECPVYRLWINSMTDEAIREGFNNLQLQQNYDKLYSAGLSRAIGDWLLGMNASRLYTVHYGHRDQRQVISIGRVQTPTLALIVKRHWEIANFEPKQYFEIKTLFRDVTFNATKGRFDNREEAEKALEQIKDKLLYITDVQKKQGKEKQPRLYDLTSLQVDCNRKYGFSADETLKYIQSLYEKKLTTYPRVDTTYLPDDIYPKCPQTLAGLRGYEPLTAPLLQSGKKLPKSKNVFDNSKVTDHHAIIPTGVPANNILEVERTVYDLVVRRFISVFYPECEFNTTTVNAVAGESASDANGLPFKVTGKIITSPGWRAVYAGDTQPENPDEENAGILPDFQVGEYGPHEPSLLEKWTKAPPLYTEASLLRAMETAGKLCDDEELRDAMKENGLGRPSTRAAIIETLFRRRYIKKEKKALVATQTGIELIGIIRQELLKSAELTGQWEKKLRQIERGEYEARVFIEELKQMVCSIVDEVIHDQAGTRVAVTTEADLKEKKSPRKKADGDAPSKPRAPRKAKAESADKTKTESDDKAQTGVPSEPAASTPYRYTRLTLPRVCPQCGVGQIVQGRTAFGCTNYANGCNFRISFADVKPE